MWWKGLLHCAKFCEASAIRVKTATGEIDWLDYPRILTGTLCQIPDSRTNSRIFLLVQIAILLDLFPAFENLSFVQGPINFDIPTQKYHGISTATAFLEHSWNLDLCEALGM